MATLIDEKAGVSVQHLESSLNAGLSLEDAAFLHEFSVKEQKRIFRKVDWHVVPMLALLYLMANLDRANIGNAKIEGLEKSLNMTGTDYNVASMAFFVSYILCEVPSNAILVRFKRPSVWMSIIVVSWGLIMTFSGFASSFGGLVAARFLLGIPESGFFPGAMYILSQWYPPRRTQLRVALLYGAAALSGAFSGLLAAGIARMRGIGGYAGWQWIFLLEGAMTVLAGVACYFILPDTPDTSKWLGERERRFLKLTNAKYRGSKVQQQSSHEAELPLEKTPKGQWRTFLSIITDWQLYLQAMIFMSSSVPTYALKFTLPQIILNMGFSSTTAQLLTAPPYLLGAVSAVTSAALADRMQWRWPFIVGPQTLLLISYSVLFVFSANIRSNVALCYTFVNISTIASYPIVPGGNTWTINNLGTPAKRAMGIAFMIAVGNLGGIVGSFIFVNTEKPRYQTGWGTCLAFVATGILCATLLEVSYFTINKRRARLTEDEVRTKYTEDQLEKMGDRSPLFRYAL
ncbi:hypothetical protein B0A48_13211 [Cryoendolithus antarcticus]|uniref:Major facilitator superfamily (MFS) profile domain-containing protein n=1 Tax=Cryoendolithus antarcticus TaxID=1507870 RepID=A0A1V8SNT0_9PEZI|nr:hypothetical protein B0A48_13211 [Cryoendolithus antarcticus]